MFATNQLNFHLQISTEIFTRHNFEDNVIPQKGSNVQVLLKIVLYLKIVHLRIKCEHSYIRLELNQLESKFGFFFDQINKSKTL